MISFSYYKNENKIIIKVKVVVSVAVFLILRHFNYVLDNCLETYILPTVEVYLKDVHHYHYY